MNLDSNDPKRDETVEKMLSELWSHVQPCIDDTEKVSLELKRVKKIINGLNNNELLTIFKAILQKRNPFFYHCTLKIIIEKTFSTDEIFTRLLYDMLRKFTSGISFWPAKFLFEDLAVKKPEQFLEVARKLSDIDGDNGVYSGILLALVLDRKEVRKRVFVDLTSGERYKERKSLIILYNYFYQQKMNSDPHVLEFLLKNYQNISRENNEILVRCLLEAISINKEVVDPCLVDILSSGDMEEARVLIEYGPNIKEINKDLYKIALSKIDKTHENFRLIDQALAEIYDEDKDYVLEIVRDLLRECNPILLDLHTLHFKLGQADINPFIEMVREVLVKDKNKCYYIPFLLQNVVSKDDELLKIVTEWLSSAPLRDVVIEILKNILDIQIYQGKKDVVDCAVKITRTLAEEDGIDYDEITSTMSDINDKVKMEAMKALMVLNHITSPPEPIFLDTLKANLSKFPNILNFVEELWFYDHAVNDDEYPLVRMYGTENSEMVLKYWDGIFALLQENKINVKKSRLKERNTNNFHSYLTELEIIAKLIPHFNIVKQEPPPAEYSEGECDIGNKRLDILIEYNGEKALIEIATVFPWIELTYAGLAFTTLGGKVKGVLQRKFMKQLGGGRCRYSLPIVIILNISNVFPFEEARSAIYGENALTLIRHGDSPEFTTVFPSRSENGIYRTPGTEIISLIAVYKRVYHSDRVISVGKTFRAPFYVNLVHSLSRVFVLKLREALFGEADISDWRTLLYIDGLDEEMAKKLYELGVDDIQTLASLNENDLEIDGFDKLFLKKCQEEARRIILLVSTNDIRFLKKIDQPTLEILYKNGIYFITQILKGCPKPSQISDEKWNELVSEIRRIYMREIEGVHGS